VISVSVARSVRGPTTDPDLIRDAASGDWPWRSPADLARIEQQADVLLAVGRGVVVGVFAVVSSVVLGDEHRIRFELGDPPPWARPLVGTPSPTELNFRRGERWPVKLLDTEIVQTRLAAASEVLLVRGHRIEVTPTGNLRVRPPAGCTVTVLPPGGSGTPH